MKILSIYPFLTISSSAILINGKIIAASTEERFNREKNSTKFPEKSIEWCLEKAKLKWEDLDLIVVPWNPAHNFKNASRRWINDMRWRGEMLVNIPAHIMRMTNNQNPQNLEISWSNVRVKFLDHHEAHAAFSYYQSGFKKASIVTIDGRGEEEAITISKGIGNKIKKIYSSNYPHSLGMLYTSITEYLGFKPNSDEWKVMALASYSKKKNKYDKKISKLFNFYENKFELDLSFFNFYTFDKQKFMFSKKFENEFGASRSPNLNIEKRHIEIAGALQRNFELACFNIFKIAKMITSEKKLVFSGGSAMNSVLNGLIDKNKIFNDSYISYAPDDSGVAIGAALLADARFSKTNRKNIEVKNNFFGPSFSENFIKKLLINLKIPNSKPKNLSEEVARGIANGKLIGWFQDKMEFGPRALGNRSILADPRNKDNMRYINKAVKFRESFRPFAPSVLKEFSNNIFEKPNFREINFMERVYKIRPKWRNKIPAVTHVDFSGRIQTVDKKNNLKFYNLINEFYKITKVPVILNTSFNLNNEPIVLSPNDAIRSFYSSGLDWLVLGNYLIKKN